MCICENVCVYMRIYAYIFLAFADCFHGMYEIMYTNAYMHTVTSTCIYINIYTYTHTHEYMHA